MKKFRLFLALCLATAAFAQPAPLAGQWKMVGWTLPDSVPVKGKLPLLTFRNDQVTGSAGCNQFSGPVSFSGNDVTFGALRTTRMACPPAVMQQEQAFLKALSAQTLKVERKGDSLTLTNADGYMLNLRHSTLQPKY